MFLDPTIEGVLLTTAATFVTTVVDIMSASKSRIRSCINSKYPFYLIIQLFGNILSTVLASYLISDTLPESINAWKPVIISFLGIFAFEYILSNTNINLFDKKVLTFQDWVYKAKDPTTVRAVQKDLQHTEAEEVKLINALRNHTTLEEINTFLFSNLENEEIEQLEADILLYNRERTNINVHLYKCKELVSRFPNKAEALLQDKKKNKR